MLWAAAIVPPASDPRTRDMPNVAGATARAPVTTMPDRNTRAMVMGRPGRSIRNPVPRLRTTPITLKPICTIEACGLGRPLEISSDGNQLSRT